MSRTKIKWMNRALVVGAVLVLAIGAGCGDADDSEPEANDGQVESALGEFQGVFAHDPVSPQTGEATLDMELTDASGAAVAGADISVEPWMPAHGHGSPETPQVSETEAGRYQVTNIVYSMPGEWELRIDVDAGGTTDRFVLTYDVQ